MPKELTISEIGENALLDYVRKRCWEEKQSAES